MFKCPHCGQWGIPAFRVLWLGSKFPTQCTQCHKRVVAAFQRATLLPIVAVAVPLSALATWHDLAWVFAGFAACIWTTYVALREPKLVAKE
jgi:hypothetical protein